jgi:hypothetical protein
MYFITIPSIRSGYTQLQATAFGSRVSTNSFLSKLLKFSSLNTTQATLVRAASGTLKYDQASRSLYILTRYTLQKWCISYGTTSPKVMYIIEGACWLLLTSKEKKLMITPIVTI